MARESNIISFELLHPEARMLFRHNNAFLIKSLNNVELASGQVTQVRTGLKIQIPSESYGRLTEPCGATKCFQVLAGVIDSDYRGEIIVLLFNHGKTPITIESGEVVAQMNVHKHLKPALPVISNIYPPPRDCGEINSTGITSYLLCHTKKDAILPTKATPGSAGFDLSIKRRFSIPAKQSKRVRLDIAFTFPQGTCGRIAMRSGLANEYGLHILNSTVNSNTEVEVIIFNFGEKDFYCHPGRKFAQLIVEKIYENLNVMQCKIEDCEYMHTGFGSTS